MTPAREVVRTLDGAALDAAKRAHDQVTRAEAMLREVYASAQIAKSHFRDVLAAATNESPKGLRFDPDTGTIYREVK